MYTQDEKRNTLWSLLQEQSNKKCMDCTAQVIKQGVRDVGDIGGFKWTTFLGLVFIVC